MPTMTAHLRNAERAAMNLRDQIREAHHEDILPSSHAMRVAARDFLVTARLLLEEAEANGDLRITDIPAEINEIVDSLNDLV